MNENIVLDKSDKFALHIVRIYRKLTDETHEDVLSKNLLSDGQLPMANDPFFY
jgi:hypothetical protein